MKGVISYLIGLVCVGVTFFSCTDEHEAIQTDGQSETVTIRLSSTEMTKGRAIADDASLNENVIRTADIFLYPEGGTDKAAEFHTTLSFASNDGSVSAEVKIPVAQLKTLFGEAMANGSVCTAYVIANMGETSWGDDTSVSALKSTLIEADFTQETQGSFVMDGQGSLTLNSTDKVVTGTIELIRAASKISLFVTKVDSEVTDEEGVKWFSDPDRMEIYFSNGVKKAHVDVSSPGCGYEVQKEDYFSIFLPGKARSFTKEEHTEGSVTNSYYAHTPFYSYSSAWETSVENAPYLTLVVPWQKDGEQEYRVCYYQVPINEALKSFERNYYYQIKLHVGVLGSFEPEIPVNLDYSYVVLDWSTERINTTLKDYRFLVVDKNSVVMDNVGSIDISFLSSHDVELVDATMSRPVLKNGVDDEYETYNVMEYLSLDENSHKITFNHTLNNDQTDINNYDYVPYTIKFNVRHKDNENFVEHIEIVQYPALYIVAQTSTNKQTTTSWVEKWHKYGYVFLNGSSSTEASPGGLKGFGSNSNNWNEHMYVINVSAFTKNDGDYIIGDPRSRTTDLLNYNWKAAPSTNGEYRTLEGYRPTGNSKSYANIVAPKFRIASSYGMTNEISFSNARIRCAAYQEDGYPAGRWRVPTRAEIKYIVKISAEEKIPRLFNDGGNYWSADNYKCKPDYNANTVTESAGGGSDNTFVRCVYDEWYWTDRVDKDIFTWGDEVN